MQSWSRPDPLTRDLIHLINARRHDHGDLPHLLDGAERPQGVVEERLAVQLHGHDVDAAADCRHLRHGEHAAIRLVGYYEHDGGYINNVFREDTYQRYSPNDPATPVASSIPDGHPQYAPLTVNNGGVLKSHYNDVDSIGGRAAPAQ